jgi:hypothetical protein
MSGRRRDGRLVPSNACEGSFRALRNVRIQQASKNELSVLTHTPGIIDELLTLDVIGQHPAIRLHVRVVESKPVMLNGVLRYEWRLAMVDGEPPAQEVDVEISESL